MPSKTPSPAITTEPRPTRSAFKPAGSEDRKNDLILAFVCLAGFLLGLFANLFGNFWGFVSASDQGSNGQTSFFLQIFVYFAFPLFLIAAAYFFWHAWNAHRKTKYFQQKHVRTEATITHLWKEPSSGSGKRYYVGYRYNGQHSAYLQVDVYLFKRLQVGEMCPVDYLPDDPATSFPELPGRKGK
jgi:hypothetical protein